MNINLKLYIIQRNNEIENLEKLLCSKLHLKQYTGHIVISNNSKNQKQPSNFI